MNSLDGNRARTAILLIQNGADVHAGSGAYGDDGGNVWQLGYRLMQHSPELLRLAIAHGANVNGEVIMDRGHFGTPIFALTEYRGDTDQAADVRDLLEAGADPNSVSHGECETPLAWCAWNARPKVGRVLLDRGAMINKATPICGTALHWANELLHGQEQLAAKQSHDINPVHGLPSSRHISPS